MKKFITIIFFFHFISMLSSQNINIEWQQCFGGSDDDKAYDIVAINNGYLIAGSTSSSDGDISFLHGSGDLWLIMIDTVGSMIWEKTYGGSNGEHLLRIIPDHNYNFYLLGTSDSYDGDISNDPYPESADFWIVKIDSTGNIIWDRILGGNMYDQMWTGTLTEDGGIVAFGWTGSNDGDITTYYGMYDMWMVKLNSNGELEWDFTFGTEDFDYGQAIIQTSDGGFLLGGSSTPDGEGNLSCEPYNYYSEAILCKLDADRNIEWQQCYGGSDHEGVVGLLELDDGYIFSAYAYSPDGDVSGWHGEADIWVVKTDFFGNIIWEHCFGGSDGEIASNIFQTEEGFTLIGKTRSNDGDVSGNHSNQDNDFDIWILKLNSGGVLISQQCIGGEGDENLEFGVVKKSDNNYVIAARTNYGLSYDVQCTPHGFYDFWVFEIQDTITNLTNQVQKGKGISVYPNPAQDYVLFEIENFKQTNSIHITNIFGEAIKNIVVNSEKTVWDCREVQSGIYFYSFNANGLLKTDKIIISK